MIAVLIALLSLTGLMHVIPAMGFQAGRETQLFSLKAEGMPLAEVLDRISRFTGFQIVVNGGCPSITVTVRLENVSPLKALQTILKRHNHAIFIDASRHLVELTLYDPGVPDNPVRAAGLLGHESIDLESIKVISSDIQGKIAKVIGARNKALNDFPALDVEVIPPEVPGEAGMTLRDIERSRLDFKKPKRVVIYERKPAEGAGGTDTGSHRQEGVELGDLRVMNADSPREDDVMGKVIESYDLSGEQIKPRHVEISPPEIVTSVPEEG